VKGTWNAHDGSVSNKLGNNRSWSLLVLALGKVHKLNQNDDEGLNESHHESNIWVVELIWVADSILHHVNSVSCLTNALPMEQHYTEEKAQVDGHVICELWVKLVHNQNASNKGHLNDKDEDSSVNDVHLIVGLELEFFLVGFHQSKEANGVHVGRNLHGLFFHDLVVVVTAGSVILVDSSNQRLSIIFSSEDHGFYLVFQFTLISIGILWHIEELLEHEIFFPLDLNVLPILVHVSNLEEHIEVESYVKQNNWCPPNGELSLKLKEHNDQEDVDHKDASNNSLKECTKRKVLAVIEGSHQDKLQEVSGEKHSNALLNQLMGSCSHHKSKDSKHQHGEPHAEPVDILLDVVEEVLFLSSISGKLHSISKSVEFLAAREKNKHGNCDNVEVEGDNLIAQPGHDLRFINNSISALLENDSSLDGIVSEEVGKDFDHHKETRNKLVSCVEVLSKEVRNDGNCMS